MKLEEKLTPQTFIKGVRVLFTKGPKVFWKKLMLRFHPEVGYHRWYKENMPTIEELERQRKSFLEGPVFSIIVPLYKTPEHFLRDLINSVIAQTYPKWELCFADGGAMEDGGRVASIIKEYQERQKTIYYQALKENKGIADNTNVALSMAKGEYIMLLDHDDLLAPNALYEFAKAVKEKGAEVLYSDEDKVDMDGKVHFMPHFKPDFNYDLLRSQNYICHLFSVKKEIADQIGGFRREYDGSQDHDFILRCVERTNRIAHIPKILYHWRSHPDSTAGSQENKLYAFESGKKAVQDHYKRLGIPAKVEHGVAWGIYRTRYQFTEKPLISVIIPNKDHMVDLERCLDSIEMCDYPNMEIIVVENNSIEEKTFALYENLKNRGIKVIVWEKEFNYSAINNFGVSHAKGEYILLLNNDTWMIHKECINEMIQVCIREDVGVVGARLYYPDDTIQHAGVIVGMGGIAKHIFLGQRKEELGYFGHVACQQDYSAVTAACLMTKRSIYQAVGGFSEEFAVAFNDIDYCLKVRELGKQIVYNPYVELYHDESKSRGAEDTLEKRIRFHKEILLFVERWKDVLDRGDPYYNKNLTLNRTDCSLKQKRERMRPKEEYYDTVRKQLSIEQKEWEKVRT